MASTTCAFCGRLSHMTVEWAEVIREEEGILLQGAATCDHCERASIGVSDQPGGQSGHTGKDRFDWTPDENFEWIPSKGVSPEFPDVPDAIAMAAKEAHASLSINARMAAILMARTVVEATAKAKGITGGQLWAKIDALATDGHIRESTREAAHEIRHFGNDMAHGDIDDVPSADDASDVLALMNEVLNEVFQGPARAARIKSRRSGTTT